MPKCENCYHTCLKTPSRMRYNRFSMCYNEFYAGEIRTPKNGLKIEIWRCLSEIANKIKR